MTESLNPNHLNRDRWGIAGMAVVGIGAAILSFDTWVRLALAVGFDASTQFGFTSIPAIRIAWLLPLVVDVYALTATRIWIRETNDPAVRSYAAKNSVGAIALSVAGNAVYHAFDSLDWTIQDCTPLVIAVGGIPPLLLGLVVHLYTLVNRQVTAPIQAESPAPIQAESRYLNPAPAPESIQPPTPRPESGSVSQITTDDELMPAATPVIHSLIQANGDSLPGEQKIRIALAGVGIAVGTKRAKRIAERVLTESESRQVISA